MRDKVVADWKAAEAEKRLDAKAAELQKRVKDGATLDAIAAELKLEKQTKRGVKREADDADFGKEGVAAIFARGRRRHRHGADRPAATDASSSRSPKCSSRPAPARMRCPRTRANPSRPGFRDDLLDQLVARLQTEYDVTVDQSAIQQALAF